MSLIHPRIRIGRTFSWADIFLLAGVAVGIYAVVSIAQEWSGPYRPRTEIHLDAFSLLRYSFFSMVRVCLAYLVSLSFALVYGYIAAKSKWSEPILIPLLDILQSVPVLGFMPGLVLALVALFPHSNLGLELAAILMIFTGQAWNMVFSFYSSVKTVPTELREMSRMFRLSKLETLRKVELPFAASGLLWNSMVSMAGGWFFLMVIESFSLGDRDFRLPGIGSYMAVAYEQGDTQAVVMGVAMVFILIAVMDRCLWAPLVTWSERFKVELSEAPSSRSWVLEWLKKSRVLVLLERSAEVWRENVLDKLVRWADRARVPEVRRRVAWGFPHLVRIALVALGVVATVAGARGALELVAATPPWLWLTYLIDTFWTLLRVAAAVVLGSLWTIPLGVAIGTRPKWTQRMQPIVQIVAAFPAPMLFPVITVAMFSVGISLEFGSVVLMLFASQWYILFNVISGATQIPRQILEVASIFQVRRWAYWRAIVFPAIFPSLVNGWISAAGGAWNACIVSEWVQLGQSEVVATGIGAAITRAAQAGDYPALAGAITIMVTTVVLLNRFFWGGLYRLAETKYRFEE